MLCGPGKYQGDISSGSGPEFPVATWMFVLTLRESKFAPTGSHYNPPSALQYCPFIYLITWFLCRGESYVALDIDKDTGF